MITLFKSESGKWSMMRLLCFIVVVALTPAIYIQPEQSPQICTLIGIALAGKWLQKKNE